MNDQREIVVINRQIHLYLRMVNGLIDELLSHPETSTNPDIIKSISKHLSGTVDRFNEYFTCPGEKTS